MTRQATIWWPVGWAALIGLTALVVAGASLTPDRACLGWFTALDRPYPVHLAWRTVVMGGQFWLVGTAVVVAGGLRARRLRSWRPLVVALAAVGSLDALIWIGKHLVGRTSPHSGINEVLVGATSYPSGHTANATMCLSLLALLAAGSAPLRRRALRAAVLLAVVVGIANLVLGYHWPSEVLAGWLLGTLVVTAAAGVLDHPVAWHRPDEGEQPQLTTGAC